MRFVRCSRSYGKPRTTACDQFRGRFHAIRLTRHRQHYGLCLLWCCLQVIRRSFVLFGSMCDPAESATQNQSDAKRRADGQDWLPLDTMNGLIPHVFEVLDAALD